MTSAQTSKRAQNGGYEMANKAQGKRVMVVGFIAKRLFDSMVYRVGGG
jgi:hypothetical protein